jgi:phospholipid/cholesterol/gamma-HCH transport system permease protein
MAMIAGGHVPSPGWLVPIGRVGRLTTGTLGYFGAAALLMLSAAAALARGKDDEDDPSLYAATMHELSWMLWAGLPLVGLVHVAMGSFLSMQAYFGSTFVDGTGAVVGVGLLRNLATMMTGLTLAGLLPGRIVPELRRGVRVSAGRAAAPRIGAAMLASPLLALWGCVVGTLVGWKSSEALMGLSTNMYFMMLVRMLWFRDVVGLVIKGVVFGGVIAALACAEGLGRVGDVADAVPEADADPVVAAVAGVVRAASLAMAAILLLNMTWFIFVYHAVPVYGPSLLQPPTP